MTTWPPFPKEEVLLCSPGNATRAKLLLSFLHTYLALDILYKWILMPWHNYYLIVSPILCWKVEKVLGTTCSYMKTSVSVAL